MFLRNSHSINKNFLYKFVNTCTCTLVVFGKKTCILSTMDLQLCIFYIFMHLAKLESKSVTTLITRVSCPSWVTPSVTMTCYFVTACQVTVNIATVCTTNTIVAWLTFYNYPLIVIGDSKKPKHILHDVLWLFSLRHIRESTTPIEGDVNHRDIRWKNLG